MENGQVVYIDDPWCLIPSSKQKIQRYEFCNRRDLDSVYLPFNVVKIGKKAFAGSSLRSIELPYNLKKIGDGAFKNCHKLTWVGIPSPNLKVIPRKAFESCQNLRYLSIPSGTEEIGSRAFANSGLEVIDIPNTVGWISPDAFDGCNNLREINVEPGFVLPSLRFPPRIHFGCYPGSRVVYGRAPAVHIPQIFGNSIVRPFSPPPPCVRQRVAPPRPNLLEGLIFRKPFPPVGRLPGSLAGRGVQPFSPVFGPRPIGPRQPLPPFGRQRSR